MEVDAAGLQNPHCRAPPRPPPPSPCPEAGARRATAGARRSAWAPSADGSQRAGAPRSRKAAKVARQATRRALPSAPSAITPARVPAAADSSRLCSTSPSLRAFSRRCWVACSVRSPGIGYPPRLATWPGAAISRSARSSRPAKRASMKRGHRAREPVRMSKAGQGLQRHGQDHHRQLRAELAQQGHGHLHQHGGGQHRRGQLHGGQKDASGGAHDRQRGGRRQRRSCPAAPRESCAPSRPAECGPDPAPITTSVPIS